jgi:hypothetical protein
MDIDRILLAIDRAWRWWTMVAFLVVGGLILAISLWIWVVRVPYRIWQFRDDQSSVLFEKMHAFGPAIVPKVIQELKVSKNDEHRLALIKLLVTLRREQAAAHCQLSLDDSGMEVCMVPDDKRLSEAIHQAMLNGSSVSFRQRTTLELKPVDFATKVSVFCAVFEKSPDGLKTSLLKMLKPSVVLANRHREPGRAFQTWAKRDRTATQAIQREMTLTLQGCASEVIAHQLKTLSASIRPNQVPPWFYAASSFYNQLSEIRAEHMAVLHSFLPNINDEKAEESLVTSLLISAKIAMGQESKLPSVVANLFAQSRYLHARKGILNAMVNLRDYVLYSHVFCFVFEPALPKEREFLLLRYQQPKPKHSYLPKCVHQTMMGVMERKALQLTENAKLPSWFQPNLAALRFYRMQEKEILLWAMDLAAQTRNLASRQLLQEFLHPTTNKPIPHLPH